MRTQMLSPIDQHRDYKNYNKLQEAIFITMLYVTGIKNDNNNPR